MALCQKCMEKESQLGTALLGTCRKGRGCVGDGSTLGSLYVVCEDCSEEYGMCEMCGGYLSFESGFADMPLGWLLVALGLLLTIFVVLSHW